MIIPTHLLCQMQANPPEIEFYGTIFKFRKKIKFCHCLFTFSVKREIRHFHVVVVQKRRTNVQKSVMHMQIYCFAYKLLVCEVLVAVASLDLKITHQKCYFPFFVLAFTC